VIVDANVLEEGKIVCPGSFFATLLGSLSGEEVEIATQDKENKISISSASYHADIPVMRADEYPELNKLSVSNFITIKDSDLKELIKKTAFASAAGDKQERAVFTGVYVEIKGEEISFVATNAHRMALKRKPLAADGGDFAMIIPAKVLKEIERVNLEELPEEATLIWKDRQMALRMGNFYIESRLIEGNFPDYRNVIPQSFSKTAKFKTKELLGAVERVALLFRGEDFKLDHLRLNIDNDKITVTSNNLEKGRAEESIPCENQGGGIEIAFNSHYISDVLKNIETEYATISLNSSVSPACIKMVDDDSYLYIVTPVRVAY
jgi:DNA polymerase-3 subunit beta